LENCIFGGCVISMLPKLGEMLEGIEVNLRLKFGPTDVKYGEGTKSISCTVNEKN